MKYIKKLKDYDYNQLPGVDQARKELVKAARDYRVMVDEASKASLEKQWIHSLQSVMYLNRQVVNNLYVAMENALVSDISQPEIMRICRKAIQK